MSIDPHYPLGDNRAERKQDDIEQLRVVLQSIRAWAEHGIRRTTRGITQDQFHYIKHACDQALPTKNSEPTYPCDDCGAPRTKAQGGEIFTVCDDCWDKRRELGKECAHRNQAYAGLSDLVFCQDCGEQVYPATEKGNDSR